MSDDSLLHFETSYEGTPPWDIGKPQRPFIRLAETGEITGSVLDVGCGTGENSLFLASLGHEVWGIDFSPKAIKKARGKAKQRRIKVDFYVYNALKLGGLKRQFDCAIDSGLFHVFPDEERAIYARSLHHALHTNGKYFMMCFSEKEPTDWGGPRRVTQQEIRETFANGWRVNYIREAKFETFFHQEGGMAWLSSISRL